jgi:hypothetical protein
MGKIALVLISISMIFLTGCKSEQIKVIDDVQMLETIPIKIDDINNKVIIIIPKGEVLVIDSRHQMKDFLVLKVSFDNHVGYVVFDSRKVVIFPRAQ